MLSKKSVGSAGKNRSQGLSNWCSLALGSRQLSLLSASRITRLSSITRLGKIALDLDGEPAATTEDEKSRQVRPIGRLDIQQPERNPQPFLGCLVSRLAGSLGVAGFLVWL